MEVPPPADSTWNTSWTGHGFGYYFNLLYTAIPTKLIEWDTGTVKFLNGNDPAIQTKGQWLADVFNKFASQLPNASLLFNQETDDDVHCPPGGDGYRLQDYQEFKNAIQNNPAYF